MGDIIEFITSPSLGHRCFKITSSGINFDAMTPEYATIILSRKSGDGDSVTVKIQREKCWIGRNPRDRVYAIASSDLLNEDNYSRFWLSWAGDVITLGKDGCLEPIIKYSSKTPKFMYVSFITRKGHQNFVHWRLELPPLLKKPFNHINKGDLHWVPFYKKLPDGVLIGGFEKENLYISRAHYMPSLTPGKYVPSEGCAYLAWGGEARKKTEFEVLCGYNCEWVPTKNDRIPAGAVEGGYSEVRREVLYVGRAFHCGHIIPGKVQPSHRVCYIPYNGKEIAVENFEVLVGAGKNRYANKYILPSHSAIMGHNSDDDDQLVDSEDEIGNMWR